MTDALPSGLAIDDFRPEIRPQDDLYRHVNQTFLANTEIPVDKARWGAFHLLAEQAEKDVRAVVEDAQSAPEGTKNRKIGDLYASFMDIERVAALGVEPLAAPLDAVDAISSDPELLATVGTFDRQGVAALLGVFVESDPGGPDRYVPFVVQAGPPLPDESYYRLTASRTPARPSVRTWSRSSTSSTSPTQPRQRTGSSPSNTRSPRSTGTASRAATR